MKNPKVYTNLIDALNRWYVTAKTELGLELNKVANALVTVNEAPQLPPIVCLCGSTRFKDEFMAANRRETLEGRIVLSVGFFGQEEGLDQRSITKQGLDVLHKRKIDLADEVYILNVDKYIGDSTRSEVEYARAHGKPVRWLNASTDCLTGEQFEYVLEGKPTAEVV
jgi:hypothetical protein